MTDGTPRQAQGAACTDIAKQMAEQHWVSTDPTWCKPNSRAAESVEGPEVAAEPDNGAKMPRTEGPEPDAGRVEAADSSTPKVDGRLLRSKRSSDALVRATREIMLAGNFRPGMSEICLRAGVSLRTGFDHFRTLENLLLWALDSPGVAEAIGIMTVSRSPAGIARMVVLGRV